MIETAHAARCRPVAAHRRSLVGGRVREARPVRGHKGGHPLLRVRAQGDERGSSPGGLIAGGLKNALGFFKARMDEMMEDDEEAAVSRVVQRSPDDGSVASWSVDLDVFLREPTTPLSAKSAACVERVSLGMTCEFAERDAGVYPSRGGAGVRGSRYFVDDGLADPSGADATPGFFWIADEPGYFKFTTRLNEPVVASGKTVLPAGDVYFNAKIDVGEGDEGNDGTERTDVGSDDLGRGHCQTGREGVVPRCGLQRDHGGVHRGGYVHGHEAELSSGGAGGRIRRRTVVRRLSTPQTKISSSRRVG